MEERVTADENQFHARLDFTAIGPDVNFTARMLSAATDLGYDHVVSKEVKDLLTQDLQTAGEIHLKGFEGLQTLFRAPFDDTKPA